MTPSTDTASIWFAVVNSRAGRLFEASKLPATGRTHLEERGGLAEDWEEKQHHRPYMLGAKGRPFASARHEDEERARRFARQAARWIVDQASGHGLDNLTVFCSASLIGPLRKALAKGPTQNVDVVQEDLAWFTPSELAAHPSVAEILD